MAQLIRSTLKPALALAIAAALLVPLPAAAQTLYGSIVGTVSDAQGAAIPGATVTATNDGTGHKVDAVSDADGHYAFRNLLPGTYTLGASLQGFRELHQTGLRVSANTIVRVELKLEVGALSRDGHRHQRHDAAADGQGRPQHGAQLQGRSSTCR